MPRNNCKFRKRDLRIVIETVKAAGLEIGQLEIGSDGGIVLVTGKPPVDDDLDRELAEFEARK